QNGISRTVREENVSHFNIPSDRSAQVDRAGPIRDPWRHLDDFQNPSNAGTHSIQARIDLYGSSERIKQSRYIAIGGNESTDRQSAHKHLVAAIAENCDRTQRDDGHIRSPE